MFRAEHVSWTTVPFSQKGTQRDAQRRVDNKCVSRNMFCIEKRSKRIVQNMFASKNEVKKSNYKFQAQKFSQGRKWMKIV